MNAVADSPPARGYRQLWFNSVTDCRAELERIVDADQQGRLHSIGAWTPGQVLAHVAAWIEYGYDGYPIPPAPRVVRWMLRLRRKSILQKGMRRGVKIPGVKGGTVGIDDMPVPAAADRLLRALDRLEAGEEAKFHSPAFGPMSHAERVELNLRHAELHLGYLVY